jgi:5-methylcytosine-specific restriction endonuclease McrA
MKRAFKGNYNMSDEVTPQKRCSKCGETKPTDAFYKNKGRKDGLCPWCKACKRREYDTNAEKISEQNRAHRAANLEAMREKDRARYGANAEKLREQARARYAANPEAMRAKDRAYCAANPHVIRKKNRTQYAANAEKNREYSRAYRAANPDIYRAYCAANAEAILEKNRAYRAAHPDLVRERQRAYSRANPDLFRIASQKRRAQVKENGGTFTRDELTLMQLTQGGFCAYCQRQHEPDKLAIDHVIPIKQGGRHEAANIVLACKRCNSSKNNRTPDQWVNRWYWRQRRDDD